MGTVWSFSGTIIGTEDDVTLELRGSYEGEDPTAAISSAGDAGHLGNELNLGFASGAALLLDDLSSTTITFHYGITVEGAIPFGRLIVNGVATSIARISELDGAEVSGVKVSASSEISAGSERGVVTLVGDINSLIIDGNYSVDHIVGDGDGGGTGDQVAARLEILSANPISSTEREVRLRATTAADATVTLYRSTDLGSSSPWMTVEDAEIVPGSGENVWEISYLSPLSEPTGFFQVSALASDSS
ncbi:MAG: hypothetical protein AAGJ79_06235 [Verrucomicrobiota bacterium]